MALVAHYRFNGDLKDSIGMGTATATGTSFVTGKIDQAVNIPAGTNRVDGLNLDQLGISNEVSVSCWTNVPTQLGGTQQLFQALTDASPNRFNAHYSWGTAPGTMYWDFDNSRVSITNPVTASSGWHHWVFTYGPKGQFIYYDGAVLVSNTSNTTGIFDATGKTLIIGNLGPNNSYSAPLVGAVDDFKIYNHQISIKEVKESFKAKILHYKFDQLEEYTVNLAQSNEQAVYDILNATKVGEWYVISPVTGNLTCRTYANLAQLVNGTTYTCSMDIFNPSSSTITGTWDWCDVVPNDAWSVLPGEQKRISTTKSLATYNSTYHFLDINGTNGQVVWFKNVQIEAKDHATPFAGYQTTRADVITDNAGYYNAILDTNCPQWTTGKIGSGSMYFNGSKYIICTGTGALFGNNFTLSLWANADWTSTAGMTMISKTEGGSFSLGLNGQAAGGSAGYLNFQQCWTSGYNYINVSMLLSSISAGWHHFAVTVEASGYMKLYMDGAFQSQTATTTIFHNGLDVMLGVETASGSPVGGYLYTGYLDDVRFYVSTLSASDVLELYQTRASLADTGALIAQEFKEVGLPYKKSLVDYSTWTNTQVQTSQFGFTIRNTGNKILSWTNPQGATDIVWGSTGGNGGGWDNAVFPIDRTKKYRFSVWLKKENYTAGYVYFGAHGDIDASGTNPTGLVCLQTGIGLASATNPYFVTSANIESAVLGNWCLLVGFVQPTGTASPTNEGKVYASDGSILFATLGEFAWGSDNLYSTIRAYHEGSANGNAFQFFYRPRVDLVDGTEPSLGDLLALRENPNLLNNPAYQGVLTQWTMNNVSGSNVFDEKNNSLLIITPSIYNSNFLAGTDGWTAQYQCTITALPGGTLQHVVSGTDPYWGKTFASFSGGTYNHVRFRIRQTAGTVATGNWWILDFAGTQYSNPFSSPLSSLNTWVDVDLDMSSYWAGKNITQIRFDIPDGAATSGQTFEIAYIRVESATIPSLAGGIKGNALRLNGAGQYGNFTLPVGVKSISVWFNHAFSTSNAWAGIITSPTPNFYIGIGNSTGGYADESLSFYGAGATLAMYVRTGETLLKDGKWHHIVWVFGGANGAWIDGVAQTVTYAAGTVSSDNTLTAVAGYLGREAGGNWFNGMIGEVVLYNRNIGQAEVTALYENGAKLLSTGQYQVGTANEMPPTNDLVVYYRFNNNLLDASGSGINGVQTQAPVYTASGPFGHSVTGASGFAFTHYPWVRATTWSRSFWIYPVAGAINRFAIGTNVGWAVINGDAFWCNAAGNSWNYLVSDAVSYTGPSAVTLNVNAWNHVAIVFKGKTTGLTDIWVNGVLSGTGGGALANNPSGTNASVFSQAGFPVFDGGLAEYRIYNRVITPTEIAQLFLYKNPKNLILNSVNQLSANQLIEG